MQISRIVVSLFFGTSLAFAQEHPMHHGLDSNLIKNHVFELASDAFAGRATGDTVQWKATAYLTEQLASYGVSFPPDHASYLQPFSLFKKQKSGTAIVGKDTLRFPAQFGFLSFFQPIEQDLVINVRFRSQAEAKKAVNREPGKTWCIEVENFKEIDLEFWKKQPIGQLIFSIRNYQPLYFSEYSTKGYAFPEQHPTMPILFFPADQVRSWKTKNIQITLNETASVVTTANVAGFIPGTDSVLRNEVIVLSAHYDHVGIIDGKIHNGADDNGTGTAALLEMARVLHANHRDGHGLKRSVLVLFVSAEEIGLLGSRYYVENPLIPLEQTIVDLNIDMIGRMTDSSEVRGSYSVHVIGSNVLSADLHQWNEKVNDSITQLSLDYSLADLNHPMRLYYRSDHYNFAKKGIPSIFYFGGFHPDYHQPTDDAEQIHYQKVHTVATLVYELTCFIANHSRRPQLRR